MLESLAKRSTKPAVIMMSGYDNPTYIALAAAWGVSDYLSKEDSCDAFLCSIENVVAGTAPPPSSRLVAMREA